jgi:hypothetical protein
VIRTKLKLNLRFKAQFNVYIREGAGASETRTQNAQAQNDGSTLEFNLHTREGEGVNLPIGGYSLAE